MVQAKTRPMLDCVMVGSIHLMVQLIFQEDSTRPYNPVEHYKDGGLVGKGQGRTIKTKKTKMY